MSEMNTDQNEASPDDWSQAMEEQQNAEGAAQDDGAESAQCQKL